MDFELGHLVWNLVLTGIIGPFVWFMANLNSELKRVEVLLNKTREEIAKDYVTTQEVKDDMNILMDRLEKLHEKVDKLFEVK